ncbi:hypothetical protein CHS0354_042562 [Potamilus streckersoni]|uniref:Uncharacterized protein n=1 Tax=Potamilus streckersoni TaxID=2493646 RepID=A0AAE0TF58_9BIVA|nr:hypothetical protein CHS0354_042562 [Potamilus streckersoni]
MHKHGASPAHRSSNTHHIGTPRRTAPTTLHRSDCLTQSSQQTGLNPTLTHRLRSQSNNAFPNSYTAGDFLRSTLPIKYYYIRKKGRKVYFVAIVLTRPIFGNQFLPNLRKPQKTKGRRVYVKQSRGNPNKHSLGPIYWNMGIEHKMASVYRPQTSGKQKALTGLCATFYQEKIDWEDKLPYVLFAYRTCKHASTKYPMVYGIEAQLPIQLDVPTCSDGEDDNCLSVRC